MKDPFQHSFDAIAYVSVFFFFLFFSFRSCRPLCSFPFSSLIPKNLWWTSWTAASRTTRELGPFFFPCFQGKQRHSFFSSFFSSFSFNLESTMFSLCRSVAASTFQCLSCRPREQRKGVLKEMIFSFFLPFFSFPFLSFPFLSFPFLPSFLPFCAMTDRRRVCGPSESYSPLPLAQLDNKSAKNVKPKKGNDAKVKEEVSGGKRTDGRSLLEARTACKSKSSTSHSTSN